MATKVTFAIPQREIEKSGVTFRRYVNSSKHGALTVRQNYLDWKPADAKFFFRVTWDAFAKFAKKDGKHTRPRTTAVRGTKQLV